MSKKSIFALVCCLSVVAVVGGSVSVAGADPMAGLCKDTKNPKSGQTLQDGAESFHVATNPTTAAQPADLYAGMVFCGSDFSQGKKFGFYAAKINYPPRALVRCANPDHPFACDDDLDLESGRFVGYMPVVILPLGYTNSPTSKYTKMYVNEAVPSAVSEDGIPNTHCTADAIACYQAYAKGFGIADMTVNKWTDGLGRSRYRLYIHKMIPLQSFFGTIYYLQIGSSFPDLIGDMHLCRFAGAIYGVSCGWNSSNNWVQKNGATGKHTCSINLTGNQAEKPGFSVATYPQPPYDLKKMFLWDGHFCAPITWT